MPRFSTGSVLKTSRVMALFTACLAVAVLYTSVAQAHGPTRQKVTETMVIDAPLEKVWALIGNFQNLNWHPAIAKTEGEGGNVPNATRTLFLEGADATIKEVLDRYSEEKKSYKYRITAVDVNVIPVTNYSATLSATETDGKTTVTWKGAFYRGYPNNDPPENLNDAAAIKAVTGIYQAGLAAIKKELEAQS